MSPVGEEDGLVIFDCGPCRAYHSPAWKAPQSAPPHPAKAVPAAQNTRPAVDLRRAVFARFKFIANTQLDRASATNIAPPPEAVRAELERGREHFQQDPEDHETEDQDRQ